MSALEVVEAMCSAGEAHLSEAEQGALAEVQDAMATGRAVDSAARLLPRGGATGARLRAGPASLVAFPALAAEHVLRVHPLRACTVGR